MDHCHAKQLIRPWECRGRFQSVVHQAWAWHDDDDDDDDITPGMMMMILHHMRHGRQDNHATNHVRFAKTSRGKANQKAYRSQTQRDHIPVNHVPVEHNAYQAKAREKHPVNAY
jgi:hypothetical protein